MRLARRGAVLEGHYALAELPRLADTLADASGEVRVELHFGRDRQGVAYIEVHLEAEPLLTCQACLEGYRHRLSCINKVGIVTSEAMAERLPAEYEPLLVGDEPLFPRDLIEDELILALPIIARHPEGECPDREARREEAGAEEEESKAENPFAVLAKLKKTDNPDEEP